MQLLSLTDLNVLLDATLLKLAEKPKRGEPFEESYKTYPDLFIRLLRSENLIERKTFKVFSDYSKKVNKLVNWKKVKAAVKKESKLSLESDLIESINNEVWRKFNKDLGLAIALGIKDAIESGGVYTEREVNKSVDWSSDSDEAIEWTKTYVPDMVVGVTNTTRKRIANALRVGIKKSEPIPDIATRVQKVIKNRNRAELIASTESVNAWSEGRLMAAHKIPGIKKTKTWRTVGDEKVSLRDSAMDGQKRKLNEDFESSHDGWTGPRPTSHPRCRCGLKIEIIEKKQKKKA